MDQPKDIFIEYFSLKILRGYHVKFRDNQKVSFEIYSGVYSKNNHIQKPKEFPVFFVRQFRCFYPYIIDNNEMVVLFLCEIPKISSVVGNDNEYTTIDMNDKNEPLEISVRGFNQKYTGYLRFE